MDNKRLSRIWGGGRTRNITEFETNLDFSHSEHSAESKTIEYRFGEREESKVNSSPLGGDVCVSRQRGVDLNKTLSCPTGILSIGEGKKLIAFTLAEILITLGIIGVVAAMTIPNLITAHQKKVTVTKIQKAISILNQANRLSNEEVGEASFAEVQQMGIEPWFEKYWLPYLKTAQICKTYQECGYSSNTPWVSYPGDEYVYNIIHSSTRVAFYTPDGLFFVFRFVFDSGTQDIVLDINGGKGPNVIGKDMFKFTLHNDGKGITTDCSNLTNTEINTKCSKTGYGVCCAEKIRRAGWQIEKDYPW